jgi:outer membrane protein OmpA-like peptidoglycan-associated protein
MIPVKPPSPPPETNFPAAARIAHFVLFFALVFLTARLPAQEAVLPAASPAAVPAENPAETPQDAVNQAETALTMPQSGEQQPELTENAAGETPKSHAWPILPSGFFLSLGAQYYIIPAEPFKTPYPGARLDAGWDFSLGPGLLSAAFETGYSYSTAGTDRPGYHVIEPDVHVIPLSGKALYILPIAASKKGGVFSLGAGLTGGAYLSIAGDLSGFDSFVGPRLFAFWNFGKPQAEIPAASGLALFAGGGANFVPEKAGDIPMPLAELGVKYTFGTKPRAQEAPAPQETFSTEGRLQVRLEDGREAFVLDDYTIHFPGDVVELQQEDLDTLDRLAELLKSHPDFHVVIAGFANRAGTVTGQVEVSHRRAEDALEYLMEQGIGAYRMEAHWYGAAYPLQLSDTNEHRAANRRVEFYLFTRTEGAQK